MLLCQKPPPESRIDALHLNVQEHCSMKRMPLLNGIFSGSQENFTPGERWAPQVSGVMPGIQGAHRSCSVVPPARIT